MSHAPFATEDSEAQTEIFSELRFCRNRFMLISKIGSDSSMKAELAGTDGILGLAYSTERGTASLLRTLSDPDRSRSSWGIVQPSIFGMLKPLIFASRLPLFPN